MGSPPQFWFDKLCKTPGCVERKGPRAGQHSEGSWSEAGGNPGTWMCTRCHARTGRNPAYDENGRRRT